MSGSNVNATKETGEPNHVSAGGKSVWWTWTAPYAADVTIDTGGSAFDTLLAVYTNKPSGQISVTNLGAVASNDDYTPLGVRSMVWFRAKAGVIYQIAVDGYAGTGGAANGAIQLNVKMAPAVSIATPANGASFSLPTQIAISANAVASTGLVTKVEFYQGTTKLGEATTSPFSMVWTNMTAGSYAITARALSTNNFASTVTTYSNNSAAVNITVSVGNNKAPTVALTSPVDGSVFTTPAHIALSAAASDSDGSVVSVDYYANGTKVGRSTASPFGVDWFCLNPGQYVLTAVATDNLASATTSSSVTITVNANSIPGWSAFNDHYAGPTTSPNATAWNVFGTAGGAPGSSGALKDILTGATEPVQLSITYNTAPTGGGTMSGPAAGTPAGNYFLPYIDFGTATLNHSVQVGSGLYVAYTFSNLNPAKHYSFRGTAARGVTTYVDRWSKAILSNAVSFASSHVPAWGSAPPDTGALTSNETPNLAANQMAWNVGNNAAAGAMIAWDSIAVGADGTFTVIVEQYTGSAPGVASTAGTYGYGLSALSLSEYSVGPQVTISSPVNNSAFVAGGNVTFTASATVGSAAISKVEFYQGSTKLGEALSSPYAFTWSTIPAGKFSISARVSDTAGNTNSSAPISITVFDVASSQWKAINDVYAGPATHPNATVWNIAEAGAFKDIQSGVAVSAAVAISDSGTAASVPATFASAPEPGTPAYLAFNSYVDWTNSPTTYNILQIVDGSQVTYAFSGLDPAKRYTFKGTSVRGNPLYNNRWSLFEIVGANAFVGAHTANALTAAQVPGEITASQAALNTGDNLTGDMVVWSNIAPSPAGQFSITATKYTGIVPGGTAVNPAHSYAFTAISVEEFAAGPVVVLSSPTNNANYTAPASITLAASATGVTTVTNLEFYANGVSIGRFPSGTAQLVVNNVLGGAYTLIAKAWDTQGYMGASAPVQVTVQTVAPVASITAPSSGTSFTLPTNITITATASGANSITNVEFYAGAALIGNDTTAPYSIVWNNPAIASYDLTAVAIDVIGTRGTSSVASISVSAAVPNTAAPVIASVSPAPGNVNNTLTSLTVTFSEDVTGVNASDLLVNGVPANGAGGSRSNVTFNFVQPAYGAVSITWAANHGIQDTGYPTLSFDATAPGATWSYTLLDTIAPVVSSHVPATGASVAQLTQISVTFSEAVQGVVAADLLVNGAAATGVSGTGSNYTFTVTQPAYGNVSVTWAVAHGITDLSNNPFNATAAGANWSFSLYNVNAPLVAGQTPVAGSVTNQLTQLQVTFSEPVAGVVAGDLLINGTPATGVTGSSANYTFTFAQPAYGTVTVSWAASQTIHDLDATPNYFDPTRPGATWQVVLTSEANPVIALVSPARGAVVTNLTQAQVVFSKAVSGVDAADLLVNSVPALQASGSGSNYTFTFAMPVAGTVSFTWAANHGIRDTTAYAMPFDGNGTGATWTYTEAVTYGGLEFNGVNSYVTFGTATGLDSATFTLETWFKWTGNGVTASTGGSGVTAIPLIAKLVGENDGDNRDGNYLLGIRATDRVLVADFEEGAGGTSPGLNHPVIGLTAVTTNVWHHAAVTYDGSTWSLYLDGRLDSTQFVGQPPRSDSIQHAALGAAINSVGTAVGAFSGVMDEARIWNYARSQTQVTNNMLLQIPSATGLLGRWGLNETAGTTAFDTSGSGINGTLVNSPVWTIGYPFPIPPTVAIVSPTNNAEFIAPVDMTIVPNVSGSVTKVEYYQGATKIGQATNMPYSFVWHVASAGDFSLTAVATDINGLTATSTAVRVGVYGASGSFWVAFNDDAPGTGTSPNASTWNVLGGAPGSSGAIKNIATGADLPVTLTMSRSGTVTGATSVGYPNAGTPAYLAFNSFVDFGGTPNPSIQISADGQVTYTFTGLSPSRRYGFKGSAVRGGTGGNYTNRWTRLELVGADSFVNAHTPNVVTSSQAPVDLTASQVAINFGVNLSGDMADWESINPGGDGTFSVICTMYNGFVPEGSSTDNLPPYAYGITAIRLEEFGTMPVISITSPASGAIYMSPVNVPISATTSGYGGVTNVSFRANGALIGSVASSPYNLTWNNAPAGNFGLTAAATDSSGVSVTSAVVNVTIQSNGPPTVAISSPANNAAFLAPANVPIIAVAADDFGLVKVEFFQSGSKVGERTALPFSLTVNGVVAGSYPLYAVATDIYGLMATSAVVNISVTNDMPPVVAITSPTNNQPFAAPTNITFTVTASDMDGTVGKVEFLVNGSKIGESTAAPFSFDWNANVGGVFQIVAVATDLMNMKGTSAPVQLTLSGNIPPAVSIINPGNNASFGAPANMAITATATDSDGTVTNLQFYAGGALLGQTVSPPYTLFWTNVPSGNYTLTAVAFDNNGARSTSAPIAVVVAQLYNSQWVAFNDQGTVGNANDTAYTVPSSGTSAGPLKNIETGETLSIAMSVAVSGAAPSIVASMGSPNPGTPAATIFGAYIDWTAGNCGIRVNDGTVIDYVFTGLDSNRRYQFSGAGLRGVTTASAGNEYSNRWSTAELRGALSYEVAHTSGVLTSAQYPSSLTGSQAAWNAGINLVGDVVQWNKIVPALDGTFTVRVTKYSGEIQGGSAGNALYSYSFQGMRLEEFSVGGAVVQITSPANNSTVILPTNFVLTAVASGFGGVVTNVAFYNWPTKLGDSATAPFNYNWSTVTPGTYTLRAVGTDNIGISVTSAPVRVTVQNNAAPSISIVSPVDSDVFAVRSDVPINVSATDSDGTVTNVQFFANSLLVGSSGTAPFSIVWPNVQLGTYDLSAVARDNLGFASTSSVVRVFVVASTAPSVDSFVPASGTVSNLTQIVVNFTEPVIGVNASDLLINAVPATTVTGSNATYTFSFARPVEGIVNVTWMPNPGILNRLTVPKPFDGTRTNEVAQYTFIDTIPPVVKSISPAISAKLSSFSHVEVTFSEPVVGVSTASLLMNGNIPATKVTGSLEGPYGFDFPQPLDGTVTLTWAPVSGIHDMSIAQNAFVDGSWFYTLDATKAGEQVVISEIMYHPAPEQLEDSNQEWFEIHNKGTQAANLTGWQMSGGVKFNFPSMTLAAGAYLVVAANVDVFHTRYPSVNNVVGNWTGALGNNGDTIAIQDALGNKITSVSYASEGDWSYHYLASGGHQITGMTRSGNTVTVNCFFHDMASGDSIKITGADQPEFNGIFPVSSPTVSTFNITAVGSTAQATGAMIEYRQLSDLGYVSQSWSSSADGMGRSMELLDENLPIDHGQNWDESRVHFGTPGDANSVATNNIPPMILSMQHSPLIPRSTDTVTITARLLDEHTNGLLANLYYRNQTTTTPGSWASVPMSDDGLHGDGLANDGVFGAQIAPQVNGTIMEFYVEAFDLENYRRTYPQPVLDSNDQPSQVANALYQVDDSVYSGNQPIYRVVMTASDKVRIRTIHDNQRISDALENSTFIAEDGTGKSCFYNVGIRNRGGGTRSSWPMNYRISFSNDNRYRGVRGIHLNTYYVHSQAIGYAMAQRSGIDTEVGRVVQVRVNSENLANAGGNQYGSYMELEGTDADYAATHWPNDSGGDIYRLSSGNVPSIWQATLDYLGNNPSTYVGDRNYGTTANSGRGYFKSSNVSQNDWTDLINLCLTLSTNYPDDVAYAAAVRKVVNVDQWMRNIAVFNLLGTGETAVQIGRGDDTALYFGQKDPRAILLAHDWDTIFNLGDTTVSASRSLFVMCPFVGGGNVPVMNRFMTNAFFAPAYYRQLNDLLNTALSTEAVRRTANEVMGDWVPATEIAKVNTWMTNRTTYVRSQIPTALTIVHGLTPSGGYPRTTASTLTLSGVANPMKTVFMKVNGNTASWTPYTATWRYTLALQAGINTIIVQSFDESGAETERQSIEVWYDNGVTTTAGGTISANTTWTAASSPYNVTTSITIANGATLTIQPGVSLYLGSGVNITVANGGRLLAEGTASAPIRFIATPGAGTSWGGMTINGSVGSPETRISYAYFQGNSSTVCIEVAGGTIFLDHTTFGTTTHQYVALDSSSFILSSCYFPTATGAFELLHGTGGVKSGGHGIVRDCFFGGTTGYNDVMDFTGGNRPNQEIIQFYNNVFIGASDDILDLDGTDAWVEGNIFMHIHKNGSPDSASAVSGGNDSGNTSEITVIGNLFYDCDQAATAKNGNFFTMFNNTVVHQTRVGGTDTDAGVINTSDEGVTEGLGFYVEGNIFYDIDKLVRNQVAAVITFSNNIMSLPWTGPGGNNSTVNPMLTYIPQLSETVFTNWADAQIMWKWFSLRSGSPAKGTGPNGTDKGGVIPMGVSLSGVPVGTTQKTSATITVGINRKGSSIPTAGFPNGSGFVAYKWRLDGGLWSAETPIASPITISGLSNGLHRVEVIGKNDAGYYQNDASFGQNAVVTTTDYWIVSSSQPAIRLNEVLASNQGSVPVNGGTPDLIELYNDSDALVDLSGMSITDNKANPQKYVFPPGTRMGAREYLILYCDNNAAPVGQHVGFGLSQDGAEVYLFGANGQLLDSVLFGLQVTDLSIGRLANGSWTLNQPTFGSANIAAALGDQHKLKINEWLAANGGMFPYDFLELYNADPLPVDLSGLYLTENIYGDPRHHQIAPLSYIAGSGYAVFVADNNPAAGPTHLTFKISADRGELGLIDRDLTMLDYILYLPQTSGVSQGRSPNGSTTLAFFTTPTPGAPNHAPIVPNGTQIVINEVLAKNINGLTNFDGSTPEWIEIFNPTVNAVSLAGMSLSDDVTLPRRYVFPAGMAIPSQGYLVVTCDGSLPSSSNVVTRPNSGFGIKASGGSVYLFDTLANGGSLLDGVSYGVQANDYSIGRVPNGGTNWMLTLPTPGSASIVASLGSASLLHINEWMANPSSGGKWFEIYNPSAQPVDISGYHLTDDLGTAASRAKFTIVPLSFVGTDLYGYVQFWADKNAAAGPDHVSFGMKASGESLGLVSPADVVIDAISFGAQALGASQGRLPDGATNIVQFPTTASPGEANYLLLTNIVINEVLSAPNTPVTEQAIELYNTGASPVNIGGWYISNMKHTLKKYRFPNNTILPAGGYKVIYAYQFNVDPRDPVSIILDPANNDNLYLCEADANANLTGYRAEENFDAADPGVSFGRYVNSVGHADFVAMTRTTFGFNSPETLADFRSGTGASNAYPVVGPVVISEIMYHPTALAGLDNVRDEYVELLNISSNMVSFYDTANPSNTWRLRGGISFDFPSNVTLSSGGYLLVVSFDPVNDAISLAGFRAAYPTLPANARLYGPYSGKLSNADDKVQLFKVGAPVAGVVPRILVESVHYYDNLPWSPVADGFGSSLQRINASLFGNDPANWQAVMPTPGTNYSANLDSDGDGIPNWWMQQFFGHPTGLAGDLTLANQDADGDGMSNLAEYLAGTNPRDPNSVLKMSLATPATAVGTNFVLTFDGVATKSYTIQYTVGLPAQWFNLYSFDPLAVSGPVTVTNVVPAGTAERFYRVITPRVP